MRNPASSAQLPVFCGDDLQGECMEWNFPLTAAISGSHFSWQSLVKPVHALPHPMARDEFRKGVASWDRSRIHEQLFSRLWNAEICLREGLDAAGADPTLFQRYMNRFAERARYCFSPEVYDTILEIAGAAFAEEAVPGKITVAQKLEEDDPILRKFFDGADSLFTAVEISRYLGEEPLPSADEFILSLLHFFVTS